MLPTNYSNAKDVHRHGGSQLWTGMFKTKIVYKSESNIPAERRQDQKFYGYLTRNVEDGVKLQFTETKSYHRRLCDDGKNGEKEKLTRSTKSLSSTETITTIPSNVSSTTININGQSPFSEYVIIGVCVSLVLLSLIIVSLACFCWQSNKHKDRNALNKGNKTKTTVDDQKDDHEVSEHNNGNNNYFVLEPVEYQDVNIDESYDTAAGDLTYDTTKDITQYEKVSVDNVYNQLQAEATYDHAEAVNKSNRAETSQDEIDEMYGKSIVVTKTCYNDRHTDNIYNRGEELEDNEYNHLGPEVRKFKTDNVYGVQEKQ
ncbi:uncharacterized protein LOC132717426 isoform X2 [Ruditapes philippinarum]|uniref:uncharacterized protein LOC132717426 isoform X2 n=1 Tax=Ruditapes philippinarum TaxID=129788 RepID=UPI00295B6875|nr:uncharacterized protein LOC132717426 isoform X2 [Ruditapes philippinarum]